MYNGAFFRPPFINRDMEGKMKLAKKRELEKIEGVISNILFSDAIKGFAIMVLKSEAIPQFVRASSQYEGTFVAVGNFLRNTIGQTLQLTGKWTKHNRYGWRFSVDSYQEVIPKENDALEKYLSCGLFKGIGPKTAALIVAKFGEETLNIIKRQPEKLREIKGISSKRIDAIVKAYNEHEFLEDLMLKLKPFGVTNRRIVKIYKRYGEDSIKILEDDPYRLADEINGFGFKITDQIARACNIAFDDESRIRAAILYVLHDTASKNGDVFLARDELAKIAKTILRTPEGEIESLAIKTIIEKMKDAGDVIIERDDVYIPMYHAAEAYCGKKLYELMQKEQHEFPDISEMIKRFEAEKKIEYAKQQKEAIKAMEKTSLLVITGGPGTGKTTIIKAIIDIFETAFPEKIIKLVAPTGRAAKRMMEATGFEAKTIHRELEFKKSSSDKIVSGRNEYNPIDADLLVIDESSMIDTLLLMQLLRAIKLGTTVIFVGDVDQLPSVGAGNVFRDLIESNSIPVTKLNKIFRQEETSKIIINASLIREGDHKLEWGDDFSFIREDDDAKIASIIKSEYLKEVKRSGGVEKVQVLSPFRAKTETGVNNLNQVLQEAVNPKRYGEELSYGNKRFRQNDKVMQFRNDYDKEVFNGDVGIISSIEKTLLAEYSADITMDERRVPYDRDDFEDLDLAYATTIHKSQGSEYDVVIMPVTTQHYIFLQRNMIYTAITRAKKKVILIGTPKALAIAIKNDKIKKRNSRLRDRISKEGARCYIQHI